MEELRSTEILDKEIQNDARKKAEKILEKADSDSKFLLENVFDRITQASKELTDKNSDKLNNYEKNLDAAIPLEKERFLVSFIQNSINKSIDEYLNSLKKEEKIELLSKKLKNCENIINSKKIIAYFYGLDEKDVKKVLDKKAESVSYVKTEFNKIVVENDCSLTDNFGIILESEDKSVRIRLTIAEIISNIQGKYRNELYEALFNGGISL